MDLQLEHFFIQFYQTLQNERHHVQHLLGMRENKLSRIPLIRFSKHEPAGGDA